MPPGWITSRRARNWCSLSATVSLPRSVAVITMSVTALGPWPGFFWPRPSATRLSAGHSPANVGIEKAAARSAARIFSCMVSSPRGLVGSPTALDRQDAARDRSGFVRAEEGGERRHFLHGDELLGRLRGEQHVAYDLLIRNAARPGGVRNLLFDERREHVARAQRVDGDALFRDLERHGLGEAGDAVLRGDIGRLEGARDERVRRGDV